jgi:hypothetical protein
MKKAVIGLLVLVVLGFAACDNSTNGNTEGVYSGFGVWLISQSDYNAYDRSKQPTPTAMSMIDTLPANFSVEFYIPKNYITTEDPGWALDYPNVSWTVVPADYYVLIVPMYYPDGVAGQGNFWWMFGEGMISGSGTTPSTINITSNPFSFALASFTDLSAIQ